MTDLKKYLPLNGSYVDYFGDVYMGKVLKLDKLKEWLYKFYKNQKKEVESKNKQFELENFCNELIFYLKASAL
jgi:hypothetical protein